MQIKRVLVLAALVAGCGDHGGPTVNGGNNCPNGVCPYTNIAPPAGGVALFTVVPTAPVPGLSLTALGSLNPPGHVLPTDHVYLYSWDLSKRTPQPQPGTRNVYMPATGALTFKIQPGGSDWKFEFRATENFYFYLDHVVPTITINVGDVLTAGTLIGTTDPGSTLDLGAFDASVTHDGFLTPARYGYQTIHYVSPWKYFSASLQPALYAQMYRAPGADKDGRIDFGIAGKLSGDWFLNSLPVDLTSGGPDGWLKTIAFVHDFYDPSLVRISIGGTIGQPGVWATDSTAPQPESVSTASGLVTYPLINPFDGGAPLGYLLVQMTTDTQISVELFMGATKPTQFDAKAFTYIR